MENERVQGSKKNFKWEPPKMEKEHTIKERPQKNRSGALRPPFVVSYSGGFSLIVCSFSILGGSHFKFFFEPWTLSFSISGAIILKKELSL